MLGFFVLKPIVYRQLQEGTSQKVGD
jgi:hypothetical protein